MHKWKALLPIGIYASILLAVNGGVLFVSFWIYGIFGGLHSGNTLDHFIWFCKISGVLDALFILFLLVKILPTLTKPEYQKL